MAHLGISIGGERLYAVLAHRADGALTIDAVRAVAPAAGPAGTRAARLADAVRALTAELPAPVERCAVSLPPSWAPMMMMPVEANATDAQLRERAAWEVKALFPDDDASQLSATMQPAGDGAQRIVTVFDKRLLSRVHDLLDATGSAPAIITSEHTALAAAMAQAYGDHAEAIGIRCEAGEIVATAHRMGSVAAVLTRAQTPDRATIGDLAGHRALYGVGGPMLLHGDALTQSLLRDVAAALSARDVRRCNPFRNARAGSLGARDIAYCRRTAHLFPAAVGAALLAAAA